MRVKLSKQLGEKEPGTVLDVSNSEAEWLVRNRYGTSEGDRQTSDKDADQSDDVDSEAEDKSTAKGTTRRTSGKR